MAPLWRVAKRLALFLSPPSPRGNQATTLCLLVTIGAVVALMLSATGTALAYGGGVHWWAGQQATWPFRQGVSDNDPTVITSDHGGWPIYPELNQYSYGWDYRSSYSPGDPDDKTFYLANWEWVMWCAQTADDACQSTLWHFWYVADGLHDLPGGYSVSNSWECVYGLWLQATAAWNAGDLGWAYTNLGYIMHHVQDALQPAHSTQDMHPSDDSIENWFTQDAATAMYSWDGSTGPKPPAEIPYPNAAAQDNAQLLHDIYNAGWWDPDHDMPVTDDIGDFPYLTEPGLPENMQKVFYLLYWANQFGSYFASDDEDGDDYDPTGWMGGYPGFPTELHDEDGNPVSIHSQEGLIDNDSPCENGNPTGRCREGECDCDGDLSLITSWCYGAAFKASPALIDLFRRTMDHAAPETTYEVTRADGQPVVEWNNSPVTVRLTGAVDRKSWLRASGLWKMWGVCDGNPPADYNAPSWLINVDGKHEVQCKSADMCGNIERDNDVAVWVDMTPPDIAFAALRPNYLTSEHFTATWEATDATSGVASEIAYLDGQQVTKGQVFDLAAMAGVHSLRVIAADNATNWRDVSYEFEVFIDATAWPQPDRINIKSNGNAMYGVVEFPAAYDVGLIDWATCTLAIRGTIDLAQSDPIVGETDTLMATLVTGVGDHNHNHVGDRMVKFDKEQFAGALGGVAGDVPTVMCGGLLPSGTPRFLAVATVPVFSPPAK